MKTSLIKDNFHKDLVDNLYDGVYFVNTERLITYWNKGAERITGYTAQDMVGMFCHSNILDHMAEDGHHLCSDGCPLLATITDGQSREAEVHLRHAEGYRLPVLVRTSPIYDEQNHIIGAVEVFSNNQSLFKMKQRVDELEQDIFRDALTGIGNRKLLEIKIDTAIAEYRHHQLPFGLLFLDIDHFKNVNDTYGHGEGDRVLQNVARTMRQHLRSTDICGRWGGEEFIAILHNVDRQNLPRIAEKLRAMIANSAVGIGREKLSVTASIGITFGSTEDTKEVIIERADQLMYRSKQGGRNRVTADSA